MDFGVRDRDRINHRHAPGVRIFFMTSNSASEKRLEELREQAWKDGVVPGKGVDVAGGPIPRKPGYYGQAVVKPPVWTWQVPLYFFFGGIAGMSAVLASGAVIFHHIDLARAAMWVAVIAGAILSPILLIMDLGRPRLFLNMLRVFKHRSAMSMGAWILSLFGACVVPGLIALELHAHHIFAQPRFPRGSYIARFCRFILEPPDWDPPRQYWNCSDTESPRSTFSDFTRPGLSRRS
jgi:hypothetical protein